MPFRRTRKLGGLCSLLGGIALVGCAGSNTPHPPDAQTPAGNAAGSSGQTSAQPADSNGGAAGKAAEASAGATAAGTTASGGGTSSPADPPKPAGDGVDFSHGTRFVIPQRQIPLVDLSTSGEFRAMNGVENPAPDVHHIDVSISKKIADAPSYPRSFEVNFAMGSLFVEGCQLWQGTFEITSVEVTQDIGAMGAHLAIEQANGHYTLTHDGPGTHQIRVAGTFRADHTTGNDTGQCSALPLGPVEVPVAYTTKVDIVPLGSLRGAELFGCSSPTLILSGRQSPSIRLSVADDAGNYIYFQNVAENYALDMIVETEKAAQIAEGPNGWRNGGLIITGEPQRVRVSTALGTLYNFQLVDMSMVDGWDLKFWSRKSQYIKAAQYPLPLDTDPAVASAKVLLANATFQIGGAKVCSPVVASDFTASLLSKSVCDIVPEDLPTDLGIPGYLATFVDAAGTCELEVSAPAANGGKGLTKHVSSILVPAP